MNSKVQEFLATVAELRDPIDGCPWDLKQTFRSLRKYMLEEAYEAATAMDIAAPFEPEGIRELVGELGDVLLQVVLNAQIGKDLGLFDIEDVAASIDEKMRRRHPHVFGDLAGKAITIDQIKKNWTDIKAQEKSEEKKGFFETLPSGARYPAASLGVAIGKRAGEINFDWDSPQQVLSQVESELSELREAMVTGNQVEVSEELGDVFFSLFQLCRHLGFDPEVLANSGNAKFLKRFKTLETIAASEGVDVKAATREELEAFWLRAKLSSAKG